MALKFSQVDYKKAKELVQMDDNGLCYKYLLKRHKDFLRDYVSYKSGTQEASIRINNKDHTISINVPYAEYQAYSKLIKKRVGKRGTQPWERMVNDNKKQIFRETAKYSLKQIAKDKRKLAMTTKEFK